MRINDDSLRLAKYLGQKGILDQSLFNREGTGINPGDQIMNGDDIMTGFAPVEKGQADMIHPMKQVHLQASYGKREEDSLSQNITFDTSVFIYQFEILIFIQETSIKRFVEEDKHLVVSFSQQYFGEMIYQINTISPDTPTPEGQAVKIKADLHPMTSSIRVSNPAFCPASFSHGRSGPLLAKT